MNSLPKTDTAALLPFLTQQECDELEALATPPSDANVCVMLEGDDCAIDRYVEANGYFPPVVINVVFVAPA